MADELAQLRKELEIAMDHIGHMMGNLDRKAEAGLDPKLAGDTENPATLADHFHAAYQKASGRN